MRVLGDNKEPLGVLSRIEALELANKEELDLVEVSPNAQPPVCRIMNFGKYQYQMKKQANDAKKRQRKNQVKIIKLRPGTGEADYQVKFKNLVKFLSSGDKVKVLIWFRGREMVHKQIGAVILDRIKEETKEFATVEQEAKIEGRQLGMMLAPALKNLKSKETKIKE